MTTDCSLNFKFNTWKFQAQTWGEHVVYKNCSKCQQQFLYMFSPVHWESYICVSFTKPPLLILAVWKKNPNVPIQNQKVSSTFYPTLVFATDNYTSLTQMIRLCSIQMSYSDITKQVFPFNKSDQIFCARLGNSPDTWWPNYADKLWRPFSDM